MNINRFFKNAKREIQFAYQRMVRGYDDSVTWSLDQSLAKLIAPRLSLFIKVTEAHGNHFDGLTNEQWLNHLNKMLAAFEYYASDERWSGDEEFFMMKHQEGLNLFAKYYCFLWD